MVQYQALDLAFAALSDPVRRAVLDRLSRGAAPVSALAADHPISLPAFMKHVRVLERAKLVTTVKVGRVRTCRLHEPGLAAAEDWLTTHRAFWRRQLESLDRFLQETSTEAKTWPASRAHNRSKSGGSSKRRRRASTTRGPRRSS